MRNGYIICYYFYFVLKENTNIIVYYTLTQSIILKFIVYLQGKPTH